MISACGVLCSMCPAYMGKEKGSDYQQITAEAWNRLFGLGVTADQIKCCGCTGPDEEIYHSSIKCKARNCCRNKGLNNCVECSVEPCEDLEKAQSVWDEVPDLITKISSSDFEIYVRPYCGHRDRLQNERNLFRQGR